MLGLPHSSPVVNLQMSLASQPIELHIKCLNTDVLPITLRYSGSKSALFLKFLYLKKVDGCLCVTNICGHFNINAVNSKS